MSKIYNKYLELKEQDSDKLYLFRCGGFYIFLADDAKKINDYVGVGDVLFTVYTNKDISNIDFNIIDITNNKMEEPKLIYEIIK